MRLHKATLVSVGVFVFATGAWAQGRGRGAGQSRGGPQRSFQTPFRAQRSSSRPATFRSLPRNYRTNGPWRYGSSRYPSPRGLYARRGLGSYGYGYYPYSSYLYQAYGFPYNGYQSPYAYPYASPETYSPYFPYLYFYDLYYQESLRSREQADQYDRALAGEAVAAPGAGAGEDAPGSAFLSPGEVKLTLDGQELPPSASGAALLLGSGRHTLRISAKPAAETPPSTKPN
jgi:hypothetical protein